ncbi:hypothetical protein [Yinghuangia soli]|uniref:Uncharacterized protein n=1 Tax=Yinghuangia soli TaxID=2908204 RepID=A0AA41Q1N6_9ACTN|nr:hypothetical protein [Yinghuangia soli]MCF2528804.1 hypothetical protein [Yinghuangia soli]
MGQVVVVAVLVAWLVVTVLFALPRVGDPIGQRLPAWCLSLIPSWSFFAPNPPRDDRVLLYRDVFGGQGAGPFREVWSSAAGSDLFKGRTEKAVTDSIGELLVRSRVSAGQDGQDGRKPTDPLQGMQAAQVMVSTPYVQLLNRVAAAPHDPRTQAVQFVIVATDHGEESPKVLFISATHRLDAEPPARTVPEPPRARVGTC